MKIKTDSVKGTFDILPKDMELRNWIKNTIINAYTNNGFNQIETPSIENLDLLTKSEGGENLSLLFKILKRGGKLQKALGKENLEENELCDLGLRYDLTLPLSRFYANNSNYLPKVFKSIQVGWVWRAERPQKNRFRQFTQCDIDIIGEDTEIAEIDLITTTIEALSNLNFDNLTIKINDRRILKNIVKFIGFDDSEFMGICITLDKRDKIGWEGVRKELLNKKIEEDKINQLIDILEKLTIDDLSKYKVDDEIINSLRNVINVVNNYSDKGFNIEFDITLIRGMGYYTGQVFEIVSNDINCSLAGGGRYDEMIGRFTNRKVPAVGFSIGFERIFNLLKERNNKTPKNNEKIAILFNEKESIISVLKYAEELKEKGNIVSIFRKQKKTKRQIDQLKEQGFDSFCIYENSKNLSNIE